MLDEKDRIFNNLYGQESSDLNSSKNRGDWSNTYDVLKKERNIIIQELTESGLRGRGGAGFLPPQNGLLCQKNQQEKIII